jgi:predicted RNA-binding Zn ribbon-like protein
MASESRLLGGRLAVDFANLPSTPASPRRGDPSWEDLIGFLETVKIVTRSRSEELLRLTQYDPDSAAELLAHAQRFRDSLREVFEIIVQKRKLHSGVIKPINEILRITEGHDELIQTTQGWDLAFVAREDTLLWLLAPVARSTAEIICEGAEAPMRICANPACSLFFYDASRTGKRRWCSMSLCGNRHKVAEFARRHRT